MSKLTSLGWGHVVLHAAALIRICLTIVHTQSPLQLVVDHELDISHLHTFGCTVKLPIVPPQKTKIGL